MMLRTLFTSVAVLSALMLAGCSFTTDAQPAHVRVQLSAALAGTQAAEVLATITVLHDRMGVAKVAHASTAIDVPGAVISTTYVAGDVVYRSTDRTIIVFTSARYGAPAPGLTLLGRVTKGLTDLSGCGQTCPVDIAVAQPS